MGVRRWGVELWVFVGGGGGGGGVGGKRGGEKGRGGVEDSCLIIGGLGRL